MKIPCICFLDPSVSEMITDSNQLLLEYLIVGVCQQPNSYLISEHTVMRKIFLDQKIYQLLQKQSREESTYPGILAGILITNTFINHVKQFS
jgi:hypothetical protein